jgi:hypothetical protein
VTGFLRRRVLEPLKGQLTQGVSPGKLALALALGLVIGSVPIFGITAVFCAIVAYVFRLNQPAIQVANYLAYPLQIALFVPFFHWGADLFGEHRVAFSVSQLQQELSADLSGTMSRYATANLRAVTAWAIVAPLAVGLFYVLLRLVLSRVRLPAREGSAARSPQVDDLS